MASHLRERPEDSTEVMERPAMRRTPGRGGVRGTTDVSLPYGQAASYQYTYPTAARTDDDLYDEPARGGLRAVGRALLLLVAWAVRLCALCLSMLVLLDALSISVLEPVVTRAMDLIMSHAPWASTGALGVDTPFGGMFRGDLALVAMALFVVDWLVCRVRANLR